MTEQDKAKLGWGGSDNQHGRPKLPPETGRVNLNTKVAPETKEWSRSNLHPLDKYWICGFVKRLIKKS